MPTDPTNAATPADTDFAKVAAEHLRDLKTYLATQVGRITALEAVNFAPYSKVLGSGVNIVSPNDTLLNTLATIVVPANALGTKGRLRISQLWNLALNTNDKTVSTVFGGTQICARTVNTTSGNRYSLEINGAAQLATRQNWYGHELYLNGGGAGPAPTASFSLIDTSAADRDIEIKVQKAVAGDLATLLYYQVELLPSV